MTLALIIWGDRISKKGVRGEEKRVKGCLERARKVLTLVKEEK